MRGWDLLLSVFGVVFAAELPDKTALAAFVLATRHRPAAVLLGAGAALMVQSLIAVGAGQLLSLLPPRPVHLAAGALFVASAVFMWRRNEDAEGGDKERAHARGFWPSASTVFTVVFVAEWGDLTQLVTAALAARYRAPLVVFAGSTLGLWAVASIAVFLGNRAGTLLDPRVTRRVAALVLGAVGVALLAGLL